MMRATGRYADGWFPGTTRADEYGEQLNLVRTAASDAGRDPMAITPALIRFIVTGRSRDEIDEVVESDIAKIFTLNCAGEAWARHGAEHPLGSDFTGAQDLIPQLIDEQTALDYAAKVPRSLVEELFAVGTPDEVVEQLAEFRDHGMRYLVVGNAGAIQPSLRKSAATTAPYVKAVGAEGCEKVNFVDRPTAMPMIDVTFVRGSVADGALSRLTDELVTVLLRAERAPDTPFLRDNTVVYLHPLEPAAQLVGGREPGEPRFRVDLTVFEGALSQERKEQLAADVHAAVCVAAGIDPPGPRAYHVWTLIHEIPEGNWAGGGKVIYYQQVKGLVADE